MQQLSHHGSWNKCLATLGDPFEHEKLSLLEAKKFPTSLFWSGLPGQAPGIKAELLFYQVAVQVGFPEELWLNKLIKSIFPFFRAIHCEF